MPNIFFTQDNFVLAFPLIAVCATYSFFKFVPLKIGLPLVGVIALMLQARNKIKENRSTDEHIDKTIVKDLVSDEDAITAKLEEKAAKKQRKADEKLRLRLAAERKTAGRKKEADEEGDERELMSAFAKGSRGKSKTK